MSQSFGRRASGTPSKPPMPAMTKISRPAAAAPTPLKAEAATPSVDEELRLWKKSRRYSFPIRPLALMASLSFGIASFVLPAEINDQVQYPLYALSAASMVVGLRRKRQAR
jgi:hypothetical protein